MPKLKLRNAYLRGWFAARAERNLPEPDGLDEKPFIDRGYEAGIESGGHALPKLRQPDPASATAPSVDIEAVPEAYRPGKPASSRPSFEEAVSDSSLVPDLEPPAKAPAEPLLSDMKPDEPANDAPAKPPKSRWDDDEGDDATDEKPKANLFLPEKKAGTNSGRGRRRYGR